VESLLFFALVDEASNEKLLTVEVDVNVNDVEVCFTKQFVFIFILFFFISEYNYKWTGRRSAEKIV
jgi:hypothetical protein